jgi:hypothetical protein
LHKPRRRLSLSPQRPDDPNRKTRTRASTPELSQEEERIKNTLVGVRHAKARLIVDKGARDRNQPAQILRRPTRSNFEAPPIWPIPAKKK